MHRFRLSLLYLSIYIVIGKILCQGRTKKEVKENKTEKRQTKAESAVKKPTARAKKNPMGTAFDVNAVYYEPQKPLKNRREKENIDEVIKQIYRYIYMYL